VLIVADFGSDVQSYTREFASLNFARPEKCPHCDAPGRLVGHGSYLRNAVDHLRSTPIRVKRFLCAACRMTISLLPSFCLPWRHYLASTIQSILDLRVASRVSWPAIERHFDQTGVPAPATCREWAVAFARQSKPYVDRLLQQLARWQLSPGRLEVAVETLAREPNTSRQLVAAVPHLLAFLGESGVRVADGAARWLVTLWRWGHAQKLGRLV
jgi:hypothetical protein